MLWSDVLTAAVTALLFSGVLFTLFRLGGPPGAGIALGTLLALVLLLFMASWGGGLWLSRVGPGAAGFRVLSVLVVGLLVTAALAAVESRYSLSGRGASTRQAVSDRARVLALVSFFGVAIVLLLFAMLTAYER